MIETSSTFLTGLVEGVQTFVKALADLFANLAK